MSEDLSQETHSQNAHILLMGSALKGTVEKIMLDPLMQILSNDIDSTSFAIKRICEIVKTTMEDIDHKFTNMYEEKLKQVNIFIKNLLGL